MGGIKAPSRTVARPLSLTLRLKRAHFAAGGSPPDDAARQSERWHVGPIKSHIKGRTDKIPVTVPPGSYVIPADVVSGMGQGNSDAGHIELAKRLKLTDHAPYYARGGGIPIMAAGGEHVVSPGDVRRQGRGDLGKGHAQLDKFVVDERKKIVNVMKNLPGPVKK